MRAARKFEAVEQIGKLPDAYCGLAERAKQYAHINTRSWWKRFQIHRVEKEHPKVTKNIEEDPPPYKISHAWTEILNDREGENEITFICWNMSDPHYDLEFPGEKVWLQVAPEWAKNKRDKILERH